MKQVERTGRNHATRKFYRNIAYELAKTIKHFFPDLTHRLSVLSDTRQCAQYSIEEIVFAAIAMFVFKCGSRNNFDNLAKSENFITNYRKTFGHKLPGMDAVALVLKTLSPDELENLKSQLVNHLIEKRVFDKWRFDGHLVIAIDGTGIVSYDHQHCEHCLKKESKNGKITWFHNVLEAKLVTQNGFSISLCTEWIENPQGDYDKQDCERRAFERLAQKLKQTCPRLSICLCADGLYPNNTFFGLCQQFDWKYIVTLTDKSLKNFWKKIRLINREAKIITKTEKHTVTKLKHQWINNTDFNNYTHNWIQLNETMTSNNKKNDKHQKFVHLTNIEITQDNAHLISQTGRLRWKIENQGFDQQKNHGYNISHQYCRKSYTGLKNFYQCCQIAHLINQLLQLSKKMQAMLSQKITLTYLWEYLKWSLVFSNIDSEQIIQINKHRFQVQFIN